MFLRKMLLQLQCFMFDSEVVQKFLQSASCQKRYKFLCYLLNAAFVTSATFGKKMLAVTITSLCFVVLTSFSSFYVSVLLQFFLTFAFPHL